jgi:hypothetical protein
MGGPANPIVRIATAVGTMGVSEAVRAGVSAGSSLVKGEDVGKGLDKDMSMRGPVDRITLGKDIGPSTSPTPSSTETLGTGGLKAATDSTKSATSVITGEATQPPTLPDPSASPAAAAPDTSAQDAANAQAKKTAQEDEKRRLRSGAGRASTILTSGSGLGGSGRRYLGAA